MDMESFGKLFDEEYRPLLAKPSEASDAREAGRSLFEYFERLVDLKIQAYHDWSKRQG